MKMLLAFLAFAAVALYFIFTQGDKVDMSGEKHGSEAVHAPAPAPAPAAAPAAPAAAPAKP